MQSTVVDRSENDIPSGFSERLSTAMGRTSQAVVAKQADISTSAFNSYLAGGSQPSLSRGAKLARILGVNLLWLATGEGSPTVSAAGFVGVPIYDVRLAAGAASFADGARIIGEMPFDLELLRQLGRASADGLGVLEADGDSMEPTVADGARVLIDFKDVRLREDVFAFRLGDELRIKRLRRIVDGLEILSDNTRYAPEVLAGATLEDFAVIGRALWAGAVL